MSQNPTMPEGDTGGGRSGRGPATHVPGEQEPGGLVPPYEERQKTGEVDRDDSEDGPVVDGANVGGARGMVETRSGLNAPAPEGTPGGRTASPADEQPAEQSGGDAATEEGTGPGHVAGTPRGEDGGS
jgi:hypothetical protein